MDSKVFFSSLVAISLFSTSALAAAPQDTKDVKEAKEIPGFDYPELVVSPRASERLEMEAQREASGRWTGLWPFQVSALATLVGGIVQDPKSSDDQSNIAGMAVGGTWLVATVALSAMYQPYASGVSDISAMPKKSAREQLVRERMAEESINRAASLGKRLKYLSVLSNLGAAGFMAAKAKSGSFAQVANGVAAVAAFTPLIFPTRWEIVAREQENYKKRIYGPISSIDAVGGMIPNLTDGTVAPGMLLSVRF